MTQVDNSLSPLLHHCTLLVQQTVVGVWSSKCYWLGFWLGSWPKLGVQGAKCAQEIVCDFDMRTVLTSLHAYLVDAGTGDSTTCKDTALDQLLYLLGTSTDGTVADAAVNIFGGLKIHELNVLNPVSVPGTPFSLATVDMTTQIQEGVHRDGTTRHRCLIVYYSGIAAFLSPINVNSFLQPSSPFCCSDSELVDARLVHAPSMGRAVAEVIAAFGGVGW